jgi:uncharacterized protein (TIGR00255 family)
MITSMTGFGSAKAEDDRLSLNIQIKAVNGRFLEARFRLPREYSFLETELKKIVTKKVQRGTLDITVSKTPKSTAMPIAVSVNLPLAQGWLVAVQELGEKLRLNSNIALETVIKIPDVIQFSDTSDVPLSEKTLLMETFEKALDVCIDEKKREGKAQGEIFSHLLDELEKFTTKVKSKKELLDKNLQKNLQLRLALLAKEVTVDPNRLAQEALFLVEKADIAEEIARADTHIKAFREVLKSPPPTGKKLEFYTQELHREVNTMGSKTQSLDVTLDIIDAKTIVERLREQVQNVE